MPVNLQTAQEHIDFIDELYEEEKTKKIYYFNTLNKQQQDKINYYANFPLVSTDIYTHDVIQFGSDLIPEGFAIDHYLSEFSDIVFYNIIKKEVVWTIRSTNPSYVSDIFENIKLVFLGADTFVDSTYYQKFLRIVKKYKVDLKGYKIIFSSHSRGASIQQGLLLYQYQNGLNVNLFQSLVNSVEEDGKIPLQINVYEYVDEVFAFNPGSIFIDNYLQGYVLSIEHVRKLSKINNIYLVEGDKFSLNEQYSFKAIKNLYYFPNRPGNDVHTIYNFIDDDTYKFITGKEIDLDKIRIEKELKKGSMVAIIPIVTVENLVKSNVDKIMNFKPIVTNLSIPTIEIMSSKSGKSGTDSGYDSITSSGRSTKYLSAKSKFSTGKPVLTKVTKPVQASVNPYRTHGLFADGVDYDKGKIANPEGFNNNFERQFFNPPRLRKPLTQSSIERVGIDGKIEREIEYVNEKLGSDVKIGNYKTNLLGYKVTQADKPLLSTIYPSLPSIKPSNVVNEKVGIDRTESNARFQHIDKKKFQLGAKNSQPRIISDSNKLNRKSNEYNTVRA